MLEYPGLYWVDSSIRFTSNDTRKVVQKAHETGGIAFSLFPRHSNYVVITQDMVRYLTTDMDSQKTTMQSGAGKILIYRTKEIYENIIKWAVLCSLQEDCINTGHLNCDLQSEEKWTGCSRFDQSAFNILCSNYFGFNNKLYSVGDKSFYIKRVSFGQQFPRYCSQHSASLMLQKLSVIL